MITNTVSNINSVLGSETTKTINVGINGDTIVEANQSFYVNLASATNAILNDTIAVLNDS